MGIRRGLARAALLGLSALAAAGAAPAFAAPADDYRAVFRDWQPDGDVAACRFSRAQLVNARNVAATVTDFDSYAPGFREEVGRELARHDSRGCTGVAQPGARRNRSELRLLRIVAIKPKGGAGESITIRNTARRAVSLKGATLRDRAGNRLRLSAAGRLGARRSLRVVTGCARARRKPVRLAGRLYACGPRRLWDDRGDVVKVVDARRTVVSQRGYGRLRNVVRF